jgi:hypothetical protein
MRNECETSVRNLKGRDRLGDLGIDKRIMLKWVLQNEV